MRFAITAFNNKCIDAEEFNFEQDKKLVIICPNKGCCSPLTYIRTIDGQRYFRHPRRKKKELMDPDFQCEQRAKSINPKAIRTYNKIVEQTTLHQIQKNFYKIIAKLHGWSEETLDNWRRNVTDVKFTRLMENIYEKANKEKEAIISHPENKKLVEESRSRLKKLSNFEIFELYKKKQEINEVAKGTDILIDSSKAVLADLANRLSLFESPDAKKHFIYAKKEFFASDYSLLVKEEITSYPNLVKMLNHENSSKMRNFILGTNFAGEFSIEVEKFKEKNPNKPYFPDSNTSFEALFGEYLTSTEERKDRPLNIIFKEAEKKFFEKWSESLAIFFPQQLSNIICEHEIGDYLKSIKLIEDLDEETITTKNNKFGFIYVAYNESLFKRGIDEEVKIGKTKSIPERSASYQTYSSDGFIFERTWSVNDMSKAEKYIHQKLKRFKIKNDGGNEWFNIPIDIARQKVDKLITEFENESGYFEIESQSGKGF